MPVFEHTCLLPVPAEQAYAWHLRPGAFERLTPPWENIRVVADGGGVSEGSRVTFELRQGPIRLPWTAVHRDFIDGEQFVDEQISGPFASWVHRHRFEPAGEDQCLLKDRIEYRHRFNSIIEPLGGWYFDRMLTRMFRFRERQLRKDLERHRAYSNHGPVRVAVTGASGLIGSALGQFLETGGHEVLRMVRRPAGAGEVEWSPERGVVDAGSLEGVDAVVHLAGESLASSRWTDAKKDEILRSRVDGARALSQSLAALERPPRVLVSASAIGYYGHCEEEVVCEEGCERGSGFLAEVCDAWESGTEEAERAGLRVAKLRIGVCLSLKGGALRKMITPFRLGLGGRVGSGRQYLSWVSLDDVVGAIAHTIFTESVAGPVNVVAPNPVTNQEFTDALARLLRRPAIMPLPAGLIRLLFGEMGDMTLEGARVRPAVLAASGFEFFHPDLEPALREELGV